MVTLTNVIIWWCTPAVLNDERGFATLTPEARPAVRHIAAFIAHALRASRIEQAAG
jgi:hypothetical protein